MTCLGTFGLEMGIVWLGGVGISSWWWWLLPCCATKVPQSTGSILASAEINSGKCGTTICLPPPSGFGTRISLTGFFQLLCLDFNCKS